MWRLKWQVETVAMDNAFLLFTFTNQEDCFNILQGLWILGKTLTQGNPTSDANQHVNKQSAGAPSPSHSDRPKKNFIYIYIVSLSLTSAAVIIAMVLCFTFIFPKIFRLRPPQVEDEVPEGNEFVIRRFDLKEMEAATHKFSPELLIGSGAFGMVYKGVLSTCETVAIKRANRDMYENNGEFYNEVTLLSKIRHKNLVTLIGFCEETGEQILVYEYISNGSLLEHITGQKDLPLTWRQRVQIAIGAAKGIGHLHEDCKPAIIHRDIKPSNILVDNYMEARVSDFGLVRAGPSGDESHVSSIVKGTPGYLDPHYCSSYHLTTFSDVYSFGVILLQLLTAKPAVDLTRKQPPRYNIIDWARPSLEQGDVENILDCCLLAETYNRDMMLLMGRLGLRCVEEIPKERPTMRQICEELEFHLYCQILQPSRSLINIQGQKSSKEESESFVSLENAGLQKFEIQMEDVSFDGINLRSLECNSISIYI